MRRQRRKRYTCLVRVAAVVVSLAACSFEPGDYVAGSAAEDGAVNGADAPRDGMTSSDAQGLRMLRVDAATTSLVSYETSHMLMHTVGAGNDRLLVVALSTDYADITATAITYAGSALTFVGAIDAMYNDGRVELWRLVDPPVGTAAVAINLDGASAQLVVGAISFFDVNPTTPLGNFVSARGTDGDPTISVASAAGELVLATMMWNGSYQVLNDASGQTRRWSDNGYDLFGVGSTKPGAPTTTFTWSAAVNLYDYWAAGAIAIKP